MWALILILPAAFFYLGSRAKVTEWLWSRYPKSFASFMDCAACSGFWFGALVQAVLVGVEAHVSLFDLPYDNPLTALVTGLITMITTPMIAALHDRAMEQLGSTVDD